MVLRQFSPLPRLSQGAAPAHRREPTCLHPSGGPGTPHTPFLHRAVWLGGGRRKGSGRRERRHLLCLHGTTQRFRPRRPPALLGTAVRGSGQFPDPRGSDVLKTQLPGHGRPDAPQSHAPAGPIPSPACLSLSARPCVSREETPKLRGAAGEQRAGWCWGPWGCSCRTGRPESNVRSPWEGAASGV